MTVGELKRNLESFPDDYKIKDLQLHVQFDKNDISRMTKEDIAIVIFNDKSWVRLTEYQKLQEDFEQFKKGKVCDLCNYNTVGQDEYIDALEEQIKELKAQIKVLEAKNFGKCPFRYSDMGCDYCDWRDRGLKEEYENELQEEAQRHEQRMFDLQCQNYDFDYGDVKY